MQAVDRRVILLCPVMLVPGLTMILPGSTLDAMMYHFELSKVHAGFIGTALFAGAGLGMLLVSLLMVRYGARRSLGFCCALTAFCQAALALAPNYAALLVIFSVLGVAFGVLVTLPGAVISALSGEKSAGPMNLVYGFFALGVVIGPLSAGFILSHACPWWTPYMLPASIAVVVAIAAAAIRFDEPPLQSSLSIRVIRQIWDNKPAVLAVGMLGALFYVGSETILNFWIPKFLLDNFPETETIYRANIVLTLFWVGLTLGRWGFLPLASRLDPARFIITLSLLGAATTGIAPHLDRAWMVEVGLAFSGVLYAAMYPTIVSYTGRLKAHESGAAFSLMAASGQIGATILPPLVGGIAQAGRFPMAMSLASIPLIAIAILIFSARARGDI